MPLVTTMAAGLPADHVLGQHLVMEVVDHDLCLQANRDLLVPF